MELPLCAFRLGEGESEMGEIEARRRQEARWMVAAWASVTERRRACDCKPCAESARRGAVLLITDHILFPLLLDVLILHIPSHGCD